MKSEIITKDLVKLARLASKKAIRKTRLAGGPLTYQVGKKIVKQYADGRQEVLVTLDQGHIRAKKKRYKISALPLRGE